MSVVVYFLGNFCLYFKTMWKQVFDVKVFQSVSMYFILGITLFPLAGCIIFFQGMILLVGKDDVGSHDSSVPWLYQYAWRTCCLLIYVVGMISIALIRMRYPS
jgi:hypothetical protein